MVERKNIPNFLYAIASTDKTSHLLNIFIIDLFFLVPVMPMNTSNLSLLTFTLKIANSFT